MVPEEGWSAKGSVRKRSTIRVVHVVKTAVANHRLVSYCASLSVVVWYACECISARGALSFCTKEGVVCLCACECSEGEGTIDSF